MTKKKYEPIITLLDAAQRRTGNEKVAVELIGYNASTKYPDVVEVDLKFMLVGPGSYSFMRDLTLGIKGATKKIEAAQ